ALQLAERDRLDPMMQRLLANLDLVARGQRARLALLCGADDEDLDDMLAELRHLDPRPCAGYGAPDTPPRVPDILLERGPDGGWVITLNPETLPRIAIDETYMLELDAAGDETRRWIARQRTEAQWILRSVAKRAETILTVTREVVRRQEGFFARGPAGLTPMTLRHVADATDLHESTVSRVAAGKLIQTPRGLFELKFFFTNAVGQDSQLSAEAVREKLRLLIEAEAPEKVLSDDDLVLALKAEGMPIARRTVAKYRNAMRIPSSVDRRRQKAFA
ncbi:MAG: RNA polymerase sigma-54 factor, partial [Pseudomonadota bacterium]